MVKIRSPTRIKDLEFKAGAIFKTLFGVKASRKELFDNDRMIIVNLEKGESMAFLDKDDDVLELSRNARGHYNLRRLNSPPTIGEIS